MPASDPYDPESLFARLRAACPDEWEAYTRHAFVHQLGAGQLPEPCFRYYLIQDYLFLVHFARAWALTAFKSDTRANVRRAASSLWAIIDMEMELHVRFCAGWGLTEADMDSVPEAVETTAYTRYVIDRGMAGDVLDLQVALAPCIVGYAEIGRTLRDDPSTMLDGNPYREWIDMYAGDEYGDVALDAVRFLDTLCAERGGSERLDSLISTFTQATRLEAAFWDMGLAAKAAG